MYDATALLIAVGVVLYLSVGGIVAALADQIVKKFDQPGERKTLKGFGILTQTQVASIVLGWPLIVAVASILFGTALIGLGLVLAFILGILLLLLLATLAITILISPFVVIAIVENFARKERPEASVI